MDRKIIVGGGVLLLVLVLGIYFPRPVSVVESQVQDMVNKIVVRYGAMPGGTVPGEELCLNGVCTIIKSGALTSSSTPMSVRNPFSATSTAKLEIEFTGTSTSAISYDAGTSTLPSRI